jgi:tetratricopeptide (TPR) repeat protein
MKKIPAFLVALIIVATVSLPAFAQDLSPEQIAAAEKAFKAGNDLLERRKYAEALTIYKQLLTTLPNNPSLLYNAGMAAFFTKDFATALEMWQHVKKDNPADWTIRAKLIQTYQALKKLPERDAERAELFAMWKKGEPAEFKHEIEYCREQFEVNGKQVMVFEEFELKGNRAIRYVFSILDETGKAEEFRISLGSYDTTNGIWTELQNPKPKEGERLFHLDGYFKDGSHTTYGMYPPPEPSYDQIREIVVKILENKFKPLSSSTPAKPETKPKP